MQTKQLLNINCNIKMVDPEERSKILIVLSINGGLLIALILSAYIKINMQIKIHVKSNETDILETSSKLSKEYIDDNGMSILKHPLSFDEAVEHCELSNKKLPTPNSQEEENELVERLLKFNYSPEDCPSYHLGYKASLSKRYIKLSKHIHLPSLEIHFDTTRPTANDKCIGIQRDFCVDFIPCENISGQCFLRSFKKLDEHCVNDIYATICWQLDVMERIMTPIEYLNTNNMMMMNEFGLLPLSKNIPLKVKDILQSEANLQCSGQYLAIGVGVAIELEYCKVNNRQETMNYESKRFKITDPNYNCLVLSALEDYKLMTESCLRPACVICV